MELTYFIPSVIGFAIVFFILFLGGTEEEEQERLERLADRLRRLYEHTGQPGLRVARLRRLPYEMHRALRALEMSLRSLERHHRIQGRRPPYFRLFMHDSGPVFDNLELRLSRLEEITGLGNGNRAVWGRRESGSPRLPWFSIRIRSPSRIAPCCLRWRSRRASTSRVRRSARAPETPA